LLSKGEKGMEKRWTIEELECMTPGELADLLSDIVLVLRRLPHVPVAQLKPIEREYDPGGLVAGLRHMESEQHETRDLPGWLGE
jgi:hypothetical protein